MTTAPDPDPESAAAIAEALRIVNAAPACRPLRPRCRYCQHLMERDVSGRYFHCVVVGCRSTVVPVRAWEPWA